MISLSDPLSHVEARLETMIKVELRGTPTRDWTKVGQEEKFITFEDFMEAGKSAHEDA